MCKCNMFLFINCHIANKLPNMSLGNAILPVVRRFPLLSLIVAVWLWPGFGFSHEQLLRSRLTVVLHDQQYDSFPSSLQMSTFFDFFLVLVWRLLLVILVAWSKTTSFWI